MYGALANSDITLNGGILKLEEELGSTIASGNIYLGSAGGAISLCTINETYIINSLSLTDTATSSLTIDFANLTLEIDSIYSLIYVGDFEDSSLVTFSYTGGLIDEANMESLGIEGVYFDTEDNYIKISTYAAIPEPATIAILLALISLGFVSYKRRK